MVTLLLCIFECDQQSRMSHLMLVQQLFFVCLLLLVDQRAMTKKSNL